MQTLIAAIGLPAAIMLSVVVGLIISSMLSALVALATVIASRVSAQSSITGLSHPPQGSGGAARSSINAGRIRQDRHVPLTKVGVSPAGATRRDCDYPDGAGRPALRATDMASTRTPY